jgi:hypothetical protein
MVRNWTVSIPGNFGVRGFQMVLALVILAVSSVVIWRQPRNAVGWILITGGGMLSALQGLIIEYAAHVLLAGADHLLGGAVAAWITNWIWVPLVGMLMIYMPLLFPDGKPLTPRWRAVVWLGAFGIVLASLAFAVLPGQLTNMTFMDNPYGFEALTDFGNIVELGSMLPFLVSAIAGVISLILRYRRASIEVRQQIKWFAAAATFATLAMLFNVVVFNTLFNDTRVPELFLIASLTGLPVAISIAILRYRLYDIDIIINRTLVYGLLSAALALLYFGIVAVLQTLFVGLTGQESPLAVVVSTLLIAALFNPLRRRLQDFIDRRFYRKKYDAQRTLEAFGERMRDEVDVDQLQGVLLSAVEDAFQPEQVRLWLHQTGD